MLNHSIPTVAELVPHTGRMMLLDRVLKVTENALIAEVTPSSDPLFCHEGKIGAWVGVEYMAQAVAAWAGFQARALGHPPRIGLLLGSRSYQSSVSHFLPGMPLTIEIDLQFRAENGLGQFSCCIFDRGNCVATADLKVFEPQDVDKQQEND